MNIEVVEVKSCMKEEDFYKFIKNKYELAAKLDTRNIELILHILNKSDLKLNLSDLFEVGSPDFIVYDKGEVKIIEFKSGMDSLKVNQIDWINNHSEIKIYLFVSKKKYNGLRTHHRKKVENYFVPRVTKVTKDRNTLRTTIPIEIIWELGINKGVFLKWSLDESRTKLIAEIFKKDDGIVAKEGLLK